MQTTLPTVLRVYRLHFKTQNGGVGTKDVRGYTLAHAQERYVRLYDRNVAWIPIAQDVTSEGVTREGIL